MAHRLLPESIAMTSKISPTILVGAAVLLIALAAFIIFRTATAPKETITRYEDVPPKGAGKFEDSRR